MNLKIGAKLGFAFGFLLLIIAVMVIFGVGSTGKINGSVEEIAKGSYARTVNAFQASAAVSDIARQIRLVVLLKDENAIRAELKKIEEERARYREAIKNLEDSEKSEKGKKLLEEAKMAIAPAVQAN
ncbi:MAG TPA: MCP four helix bundle domain-containing protein, partial [Geobacteraceae bacterium]